MTSITEHRFSTLDAMRGVAAIAVMIFHFRYQLNGQVRALFGFNSGYLAVDLFFVLSGFVLAQAYDRRFEAGMGIFAFWRLRMIRLLPMIWTGVAVGTGLLLVQRTHPITEVAIAAAASALILPNGLDNRVGMFPLNIALWSLFFEILANMLWTGAFPLLRRWGLAAVIGLSALGLLWCAITFQRLQDGWTWDRAYVGLLRVGYSFFVGVTLSRTRRLWAPRVPVLPPWLLLSATAAFLLPPLTGPARAIYDPVFVLLVSPALVIGAAVVEPRKSGRRLAAMLGLISYPLYAIHLPIRHVVGSVRGTVPILSTVLAVSAMAACVFASWFLASTYDPAVRRWLTRWLLPRTRARA